MFISRGRRFIFVHIPKTGGTALTLALEQRALRDDVIIGDTPKARARQGRLKAVQARGRIWKHATLRDIDGLVTDAEVTAFFIVTLVRNPWDRMVSYYNWLRVQRFDHPAVALAQALDFSAFLNHPDTRRLVAAWPACAYTQDQAGRDRVDLCARLEHLETDLTPFEAHLGFRLTPMARVNASDRARDWRGYYSDADADLVAQICAPDVARFGYAFDP